VPGYLTADGLDDAVHHLASTYPFCEPITLPERSVEGRAIHAVRIGKGRGPAARGIFLLAGIHAREVVNPDLLVYFGLQLCRAYEAGGPLAFGGRSYPAGEVARLVEGLGIYLLPLANPDGRIWVQTPGGDHMWRKNRRPNPNDPDCPGVDVNRNYDFLWSSGIGSSDRACSSVFKGPSAFSEPETRNVRHLVETYPDIHLFVDLHSYSESIFYPWGDAHDQSDDPSMSFANPAWDAARAKPHERAYHEYIPKHDLDWYVETDDRVRDAIASVRGTKYGVVQSVGMYPTSGCSDDYTYSRFRAGTLRKVMAFTVETAKEFQPKYAEAEQVIVEVSAGLVEYCRAALALRVEGS
jgi:murein tripeptide amidase MpaA